MNPFSWSFREQFLLGATVSLGMIVAAITVGGVLGLEACPLCIFQRVAFGALGLMFLLGALFAPSGRTGRGVWSLAAFAAACVGIGIAGRHVWLQLFPSETATCGMPLSFMRETMDTPGLLRQLYNQAMNARGDCALVDWSCLGLAMPAWSLVWFVLLAAWALYTGFRGDRRKL